MSNFPGQYGEQTDEFGNPIRQTQGAQQQQHGLPGQHQPQDWQQSGQQQQHRPAYDQVDPMDYGQQRQQAEDRSMMDKVTEKIPGTESHERATGQQGLGHQTHHDDKSTMEKIKEKIPEMESHERGTGGTGTGMGAGAGRQVGSEYAGTGTGPRDAGTGQFNQ